VLAAAVLILAAPALAQADPATEKTAEAYVHDGVSAFNLGRFADASALFEKAYKLDPAPILLFNIGQSERRLGNNERALFFYRRFLAEAPADAPERKEVEERVAELERWVSEQAALKDRPPPGVQREIAPPSPTGTGGRAPLPAPPHPSSPAPGDDDEASRVLRRRIAWITGGAATAALLFGSIEGVLWASRANRFNDHVGPAPDDPNILSKNCGADTPNRGGPGCAALYDEVSSARTLAMTGLIAGGVLAAGSAILFVSSTRPEAAPRGASVACAPSRMLDGLTCGITVGWSAGFSR
jgi:tetratricopeptide (TPR) repeat protein